MCTNEHVGGFIFVCSLMWKATWLHRVNLVHVDDHFDEDWVPVADIFAELVFLKLNLVGFITIHMPQKWNLSSSVKCVFSVKRERTVF